VTYPTGTDPINSTGNYIIGFANVSKIYHPQIEYGIHATEFDTSISEQESMIR
jgi:hypothetical protein